MKFSDSIAENRASKLTATIKNQVSLLAPAVAFALLRGPKPELFKQEFPHFMINQFFLDYETIVMSIGYHYDFCMRKPALKFGN